MTWDVWLGIIGFVVAAVLAGAAVLLRNALREWDQ